MTIKPSDWPEFPAAVNEAIARGAAKEADDKARAAATARRAEDDAKRPRVELGEVTVTAPRLNSRKLAERDYSRLERAELARHMASMERDARRAEAARRRAAEAANRAVLNMPDGQLAKWAEAAGAGAELAEAQAMAEAAEAMGVTAAELAAELERERLLVAIDAAAAVPVAVELAEWPEDAGAARAARAARAEAAEAARAARAVRFDSAAIASTKAAQAGRAVLAAIGPVASAVVIPDVAAGTVTVAKVVPAKDAARAERAAEAAAKRLAAGRAKLAEAEAAVLAAEATKAARPIRETNKEADRVAAAVAKLAAKLTAAEAAAVAAGAGVAADSDGRVSVPVATFKLAEAAAEAAVLELPKRADVMPVGYVESGPSARHTVRPVSDPAGNLAAAVADGQMVTVLEYERRAREHAYNTTAAVPAAPAAIKNGRPAATDDERLEYKARRAMAAKNRRRAAKRAQS